MLRLLVLAAVLGVSAGTTDQMLEAAEDEAMAQQPRGLGARMVDRLAAVNVDGGVLDMVSAVDWASELRGLRLGDDAYTDDVLPYIAVGDDAATLMEAPGENGLAVLRRKQQYAGLEVEVLESQLVVLHGMEKPEERRRREAAGLSQENRLASQLACRPINGSAMFMLAHRWADRAEGSAHGFAGVHQLAFFTAELWATYLDYLGRARQQADFFGGAAPWTTRIHWTSLPLEQRVPFVLPRPELRVVARPDILAATR